MVNLYQDRYTPYLYAVLAPSFATLLGYGVELLFPKGNISLLYLLAVLLVASRSSYKPALVCAITSFLLYNLFFTNPRLSLIMTHREDILTVFFFVVVALLAGHQAVRLREQINSLQIQEHFLKVQLQYTTVLQDCFSIEIVIQRLQSSVKDAFGQAILIKRIDRSEFLEEEEIRMVHYSDSHCRLFFGKGQDALDIELLDKQFSSHWYTVLNTLFQQAKLAIARSQIGVEMQNERLRAEQEHLRSALLSSVSHDLKTPLASMIGAASTLRELAADLNEDNKNDLLDSVLEEARRLEGYIQNLLDMTRLGQGELSLSREWISIDEIIHVVIRRANTIRGKRLIDVQLDEGLPLIYVHPALIEQAIFNVLENATKFSPVDSTIAIKVTLAEPNLQIDVIDEGPGIPPDQRDKVFDMFHSVSRGDYQNAGTGLGLAICQGMLGAHGGRAEVVVLNPGEDKGACIRLFIPLHDRTISEVKTEFA